MFEVRVKRIIDTSVIVEPSCKAFTVAFPDFIHDCAPVIEKHIGIIRVKSRACPPTIRLNPVVVPHMVIMGIEMIVTAVFAQFVSKVKPGILQGYRPKGVSA